MLSLSRRLLASIVPFLASLLIDARAAANAPVHLFILSGQSNMVAVEPERAFLPELRSLLPDSRLLHCKVAVSGEPIRFWLPEWDEIAADAGFSAPNEKGPVHYEKILAEFKSIAAAHPKIASVTFCWMQGERDAKTGLADLYERALTRLIVNLRRDLGRPDLYVVIGRLSDHSPGPDLEWSWNLVRRVQKTIATRDPRAAWVDTDDLNGLMQDGQLHDDLHYTPNGYLTFAQRLARQSARLILEQDPDPTGRP